MLLVVAATEIELQPLQALRPPGPAVAYYRSGVGPVETAVRLTNYCAVHHKRIDAVINVGIAGAYHQPQPDDTPPLLEICLAEREVLGDFGVTNGLDIEPFSDPALAGHRDFALDEAIVRRARTVLTDAGFQCRSGTFVTVSAASGTTTRGSLLQMRYQALCENMEGAALARVCHEFGLPLLAVRVISNFVEDRPGTTWETAAACRRAADAVALLIDTLQEVP